MARAHQQRPQHEPQVDPHLEVAEPDRGTIRVLLVEDHPVLLRGLGAVCEAEADLDVVAQATTATDALEAAAILQPDVILIPVRLDGTRSGIELCRSLKSVCRADVIVFTAFTRSIEVQVALLAGADALVGKTAEPDQLVAAIRRVAAGDRGLVLGVSLTSEELVRRLVPTEPLTEREQEILRLVTEGLTNPEIALRLRVEVSTVKSHVRNVLRKLAVETRRDLLVDPGR